MNNPQDIIEGVLFLSKYKVDITGIDTSKLMVLSNDEMIELFKKYKNGDTDAKNKIVNGNLKLVLSIASKYRYKNIDMNDLFQVGCVGLIKAVDNFDLSFGVMFSTYAVPLILGEIKRLIRTNTSLRIARSIRDTAYNIMKYKEEYNLLYGIEPSLKEIGDHLNISEYDIKLALSSLDEPSSIDEPIFESGDNTIYLIDQIADKKGQSKEDLIALKEALIKIKEREREVLIDRYIIGSTQNEIAEKLKISQAQVSRIEKSAIKNVKKLME